MTSIVETDLPEVSLAVSGWELRVGRGSRWRPALEVHTGDGLIDVAVAGGLDSGLLRGALRGRRRDGRAWALAWGHLADGERTAPSVAFQTGRAGRDIRQATAQVIADSFWVAEMPGSYRSVTVSGESGSDSARLRRYRPARRSASPEW